MHFCFSRKDWSHMHVCYRISFKLSAQDKLIVNFIRSLRFSQYVSNNIMIIHNKVHKQHIILSNLCP